MIRAPQPVSEPSVPPPHPPAAPAELQADPAAGLTADEMDVFEPAAPATAAERRLGSGVALLMVAAVVLVVLVFTLLK